MKVLIHIISMIMLAVSIECAIDRAIKKKFDFWFGLEVTLALCWLLDLVKSILF